MVNAQEQEVTFTDLCLFNSNSKLKQLALDSKLTVHMEGNTFVLTIWPREVNHDSLWDLQTVFANAINKLWVL